jgi:acetylornithine deacetylase/succinyl-diaminopimelate desuccinylase-like protein
MKHALLAGLGLLLLGAAPDARAADLRAQVQDYRLAHEQEIVGRLDALTRIDSVAASPAGLAREADTLLGLLKTRGFDARLLSPKVGPPVVFGALDCSGCKRTVVFYAHYDGQPVTPSEWATPPFEPVMRSGTLESGAPIVDWRSVKGPLDPEWRLFGRAASDDKASIVAFLAAFDALGAIGRKPSVNIKVVWEGEEEAGSPHLREILTQNEALLQSDLWLIGDALIHASRRQMIYFGARGSLGLELTIYGPLHPVHDGHYGNWAPNPAVMAATLVSQMRDDEGRILIPGFYDDVAPLTAAERAAIAALPPVETELKREFGIGRSEGSEGLTASTMRPALNIRGIRSGQVGEAATNSIPAEADISIDFRLAPGQTPDRVRSEVEAFLAGKGWTLASDPPDLAARLAHPRILRLAWADGYPALRTDMTTPAAQAVVAAASQAAGQPVAVLPMMGASVPIYVFHDVFGVPVIGLPIVNHDNSQHAPNENMRLQNLWDGTSTYAEMMADLAW